MVDKKNTSKSAEETRRRLLMAGLRLFGRRGLEGVTTRQLAAEAGTNQAAIPYHFGGKEELYLAVAHMIIDEAPMAKNNLVHALAVAIREAQGDKKKLREAVVLMASRMCNILAGRGLPELAAFVLREYSSPGKAFDIIYEGMVQQMHTNLTLLVEAALGLPADSEEAILRAHTLMGTMFGFVAGRVVLLRRLGWEGYGPEEVARIENVVREALLANLGLAAE